MDNHLEKWKYEICEYYKWLVAVAKSNFQTTTLEKKEKKREPVVLLRLQFTPNIIFSL